MRLDYAEVVDAATLEPVERDRTPTRWLRVAAFVGTTRLIDNVTIDVPPATRVSVDLGVHTASPGTREAH